MQQRLAKLATEPFSYAEVGASATQLPAGYRHARQHVVIGRGEQTFHRAAKALLSWEMHRRAGGTVYVSVPTASVGAVVVVTLGLWPVRVEVPCRVVYEVDEPRRRGFGYGTLPGHPVSGEEAFLVEHRDDDAVTFTVVSFSRPARWYMRIAGPLGVAAQRLMFRRYVRALARAMERVP